MKRPLFCAFASSCVLLGCGGGGPSPSPFSGAYGGDASLGAFDSAGFQVGSPYTGRPTKATIDKGGRFRLVVTDGYTEGDAAHVLIDTVTGNLSRAGAITNARRTVTIDGAPSATDSLSGGTGLASLSFDSPTVYMTFPVDSGTTGAGTLRYVVQLHQEARNAL